MGNGFFQEFGYIREVRQDHGGELELIRKAGLGWQVSKEAKIAQNSLRESFLLYPGDFKL